MLSRRELLALSGAFCAPLVPFTRLEAAPKLRVTGIDLLAVRATSRTVWLIVQLRTDAGLPGSGKRQTPSDSRTQQPMTRRACERS